MEQADHNQLILRLLVIRCQLGDGIAFERLLKAYHPRLRYFVRQLVGPTALADDIVQEVWLSVYRKIPALRQPEAFAGWLYSIARHKVYHAIGRPTHVQLPEDLQTPQHEGDDGIADQYDVEQINRAMGRLMPEHREVLILRYFDGLAYCDIAKAVNCPAGTVKSRLNIAKKRLREFLEKSERSTEK